MNHQEKNLENDQLVNCERHVVERLSANRKQHLWRELEIEKEKLGRKREAAAEGTRMADRRKGKLRKIHHRGSLDRTRVQPDVVEHAGLETQRGVHACG